MWQKSIPLPLSFFVRIMPYHPFNYPLFVDVHSLTKANCQSAGSAYYYYIAALSPML